MALIDIMTPRVNANEDEVLVAELHVAAGDQVAVGDLLISAETTKASVDIEATHAGLVSKINGKKGRMIASGSVIVVIDTGGDSAAAGDDVGTADGGGVETKVTTKARLRAEELGVDLDAVQPKAGRIGVAEVEAAARKGTGDGPEVTAMQAVLVGGGGHGATIGEIAVACGWDLIGAVDAKLPKGVQVISGVEVIDADDALQSLYDSGIRVAFLGIGGATSSDTRRAVYEKLKAIGFILPPLVHPTAHFGADVKLGPASYVLPHAMVGPRCRIGANVIVNSSSTVAHDCVVGDHAHLTPAAILAGNVQIGAGSVIGMGASVLFGVSVGQGCLVHNNVSVLMDVPDFTELSLEHAPRRRDLDA